VAFQIRNKRLSDDQFFKIRKEEVLSQWETAKEIENLDACIAAAKELSRPELGYEGKNYAMKLPGAQDKGKRLLIPQFGRALTEYMEEGLTYVEAESDLYPHGAWNIFSDSYTRKNDYRNAAAGIERSRKEGMAKSVRLAKHHATLVGDQRIAKSDALMLKKT